MVELEYVEGLSPKDLGISNFPEYRRIQLEAIEFMVCNELRFTAMSIPTGGGKSLIAFSLHKYTGLRTAILTATLALQSQYFKDLGCDGLVDVRGRSNYQCVDFQDGNCAEGVTRGCRCVNGKGCEYERARDKARNAASVITSYAYWLTSNDKANGIERSEKEALYKGENPIELLICDEADASKEWLEGYLAVRVYESEIKRWCNPKEVRENEQEWRQIAETASGELETELEAKRLVLRARGKGANRNEIDEVLKLERTLQKFERIKGIVQDEWVIERREGTRYGRMWSFDVVWPGRYAEKYLFCNVPKIVVMSATLRPKEMGLLGIGKDKFSFKEWPRIFPANRHQIYSIPARGNDGKEVRVDRRTTDSDMRAWVAHIDDIIGGRLDRKGLIQTVSYDRQRYLLENSVYSKYMVGNTSDPDSDSALEVAEEFRKRVAPCILVSPSFARGWDFPGDQVEFIVICKVPFKPNNGKVQKAREERDPQYGSYLAMQEMVQSAGRGMRSAMDRCEVFICDGHVNWFLYKNKSMAPEWFVNTVRKVGSIPKAAEKLRTEVQKDELI